MEALFAWLLAPIDAARGHEVGGFVAWHGRMMVLAWGALFPLGVLVARFGKITRRQDWPRELDNRAWWRGHLALQYSGGAAMLAGLALILAVRGSGWDNHALLGWSVAALAGAQFLAGWARGSKGGPTEPSLAGDHYDMTPRRRAFEYFHKFAGYALLALAAAAVLTGLWRANAPVWMWLGLALWWAVLAAAFAVLQRRGFAVDTYQAIWGPDPAHPGNRMRPIGFGIRRLAPPGDGPGPGSR